MIAPNPDKIQHFRTEAAFETWLRRNHAREDEVWVRIYKKGSDVPTVTIAQALDVVLCWGWIDGIRKSYDEQSYLQRYTPRRARSLWSQINREHIARLTAAGRMTEHGQRQVDAAKADGRWDAAYAPLRSASKETLPEDLRAAIDASPRARQMLETLTRQQIFALAFRTNNMKTEAGRTRKIAALVAMLERGETHDSVGASGNASAGSRVSASKRDGRSADVSADARRPSSRRSGSSSTSSSGTSRRKR